MDESLSGTVVLCPLIEQLTLSSCLAIGDDGLYSLSCLGSLTLLDLSYTFLINLQPVFDSCSQLKVCCYLLLATYNCFPHHLSLSMPMIYSFGIQFKIINLISTISSNFYILFFFVFLVDQVLKLSACKYLTDSSLDALYKLGALPSLLELDLSYSSIGQSAITELLASCTNLVNVNLNGCTNLHELVCFLPDATLLDDSCPSDSAIVDADMVRWKSERLLEVLNCTGCPNIRKVVIPSGANCLHLSKINLNLSTNLKEVSLTCSNLSILNLR